jgi:hypothetical protein
MDGVSAATSAISTSTDLSMVVSMLSSTQAAERVDVSIMLSSIGIGQNFSGVA